MANRRVACVRAGIVQSIIVVPSGDSGSAFLHGPHAPTALLEDGSRGAFDHFVNVTEIENEPREGFLYDTESETFSAPAEEL